MVIFGPGSTVSVTIPLASFSLMLVLVAVPFEVLGASAGGGFGAVNSAVVGVDGAGIHALETPKILTIASAGIKLPTR